ncbi:hypothetical protein HGM15179_020405, partial [Zosterops borbonicus]
MEVAKMVYPKSAPKDAQVMAQILKDMGITEYEPHVINQMLEFAYIPAGHCPAEEPDAANADQALLGPMAATRQVLPDCPQLPPQIPAEEEEQSYQTFLQDHCFRKSTSPGLLPPSCSGTSSAQTVSLSAKVGAPVSLAGQHFTVQIPSLQPAGKSATPTTPMVQNVLINPSLISPKNILITTNMVPPSAADPNPLKRKHEDDDDYHA